MADLFYPKNYPLRKPTDTNKMLGRVANPPRVNEIGGMDKLHEKYGAFKNKMGLKKPGGTI